MHLKAQCLLLAFASVWATLDCQADCKVNLSIPPPEVADSFQFPVSDYSITGYQFAEIVPPRHLGEDVLLSPGVPVVAVANGNIIYSCTNIEGYAQVEVIEHQLPDGTPVVSIYGHLSRQVQYPLRLPGPVKRGEIIGYVGTDSENGKGGPHLHLGFRKGPHASTWVYYGYAGHGEDVDFDLNGNFVGGLFTAPAKFIAQHTGPTLDVSAANCLRQPVCSGAQGTIFNFGGSGFTSTAVVHRFIQNANGAQTELIPLLSADTTGQIAWTFSSSCSTPTGTFTMFAVDASNGRQSNSVKEIITAANCPVSAPTINVTPSSWDFGPVNLGSSARKDFVIQNTGTATLTVNKIDIVSQGDFDIAYPVVPFGIAPGQANTFTVFFSPITVGQNPVGTVSITSNAAILPTTVSVAGTGANPPPPRPANQGGGPAGGDIRCLAIDPSNPSVIYAGAGMWELLFEQNSPFAYSGGIFKSTDGGQTWITASNGLPKYPVQTLAVDPKNPLTVYASTWTKGIFKTVDGGQNWSAVNLDLTGIAYVIAINPGNSTVYILGGNADPNTALRSSDGGNTWVPIDLGISGVTLNSLTFDPSNSQVVYATSALTNGAGGGFFKSTDSGQSWTLINTTGLVTPFFGAPVSGAIAVDPSNPATLYIASNSIYKSVDSGLSWMVMSPVSPWPFLDQLGVSIVLIDPSQPTTLYAAGKGIFKSADAGVSWTSMNFGLSDSLIQAFALNPTNPSVLYVGTASDGVFKTSDGAGSWRTSNSGITARAVRALAVDPFSGSIYAGSSGALFKSADGGITWLSLDTGIPPAQKGGSWLGFLSLALDPANSNTVYAGGTLPSLLKSIDAGQSWLAINDPHVGDVSDFAFDPTASSTIYTASPWAGVSKSTDSGMSWSLTPISFTPALSVTSIALDPSDPTILYSGSTGPTGINEGIFKLTDGAETVAGQVLNESIASLTSIAAVPHPIFYAGTFTGSIAKSIDGGSSWENVQYGLTDPSGISVSVRSIAIDSRMATTVYAGTFGAGVLKTTDGGQTWSRSNTGLSNLKVLRIVIDPANSSIIYAATSGSGIFKSTDAGQTWQPTGAN